MSRSAHHYDTVTFIVTFTDLSEDEIIEDERDSIPTKNKAENLRNLLRKNCEDVIYQEKCDELEHQFVRISSYQALAYFYKVAKNEAKRDCSCKDEFGAFDVFTLKCSNEGYLISEDALFKDILRHINIRTNLTIQPCNVFCELDTNDINTRLVLIPKEEEKNFFHVTASYQSSGAISKNFSKGFIDHIVSAFPENYVIWRMSNSVKRLENKYDEGAVSFFIKDIRIKPSLDRISELEQRILTNRPDYLSQLHDLKIDVKALRPADIGDKSRKFEHPKQYDVFVSFSSKDKEIADNIYNKIQAINFKCFLSGKEIKAGENFADRIQDALRRSNELVLLISENSLKSPWVQRECGAAWALGIQIIPILYNIKRDSKSYKDLFFQHLHSYSYDQLETYLRELQDRYT